MRESTIERKVCEYAKERGVLVFKCTGQKGIPDRLFHYKGLTWYVEFKAPGKTPTTLQDRIHNKIKAQSIPVHVIDDLDRGIETVRSYVNQR